MTSRPIYEPTPEEIRLATEAYRADPERWPKERLERCERRQHPQGVQEVNIWWELPEDMDEDE
jgi:hypothetical protein